MSIEILVKVLNFDKDYLTKTQNQDQQPFYVT